MHVTLMFDLDTKKLFLIDIKHCVIKS